MKVGIDKDFFGFCHVLVKSHRFNIFIFSTGIPLTLNWNDIVHGLDEIDLSNRSFCRPGLSLES